MTARRRKAPDQERDSRHRIVPVWRAQIDRGAFARALQLLVLHLDETERAAHKLEQTADPEGGNSESGL